MLKGAWDVISFFTLLSIDEQTEKRQAWGEARFKGGSISGPSEGQPVCTALKCGPALNPRHSFIRVHTTDVRQTVNSQQYWARMPALPPPRLANIFSSGRFSFPGPPVSTSPSATKVQRLQFNIMSAEGRLAGSLNPAPTLPAPSPVTTP